MMLARITLQAHESSLLYTFPLKYSLKQKLGEDLMLYV